MKFWAIVPAAGIGQRMGAEIPKQYLEICGHPILWHTLSRLSACAGLAQTIVPIRADDTWWPALAASLPSDVVAVEGGEERCHSVLNGLRHLVGRASVQDWVMVHDAVRPCLSTSDLQQLIDRAPTLVHGAVLGRPVADTMKRCDASGVVVGTVDRTHLWHAATPQMFRLGPLLQAIEMAIADGVLVTDEAQAMELAGAMPTMIDGHPGNIKVTRREDLDLAGLFLT